jgi:cell division protein FtsN
MKRKPLKSKRKFKKKIKLFRAVVWTFPVLVLGLAFYCFYFPLASAPLVIEASSSFVRVPGPAQNKQTLSIYRHLEKTPSEQSPMEKLLPPVEIPDWTEPTDPTETKKDVTPPAPNAPLAPQVISSAASLEQSVAQVMAQEPEPVKLPAVVKKRTAFYALQIGPVYTSLKEASIALAVLQKKYLCPPGVLSQIQKAKKGSYYRLMLQKFTTKSEQMRAIKVLKLRHIQAIAIP